MAKFEICLRHVPAQVCGGGEARPRSNLGTGAKALLGMGTVGEDGDDQPLGLGAEASRPSFEARGDQSA